MASASHVATAVMRAQPGGGASAPELGSMGSRNRTSSLSILPECCRLASSLPAIRPKRVHALYHQFDADPRLRPIRVRDQALMTIPYGNLLGRALTLLRQGDPAAAETICHHVLTVDPRNATALYLAGVIAHDRFDHVRSFEMMNRAIEVRPDFDDALCWRGIARRHLGQAESAPSDFERALAVTPRHAPALYYVGLSRFEHNDLKAAADKFESALAVDPDPAGALANLGLVRHRQHRLDDAVRLYGRALELEPTLAVARNNLAGALQELGRAAEALALLHRLDWENADPIVRMNVLACLNLVPGEPPSFLSEARHWARRFANPVPPIRTHRPAEPTRRLRIGYVAASGLARHTLAMTYLPLLAAHDRERFDIAVYSDLPPEREDDVTRRAHAFAGVWHRTRELDDAALAERIAADGIDVLVDGIGFAAGSRLLAFARRPAPVLLPFPPMSTPGMHAMDYVVGDARLMPPGVDAAFAEKLWRLPLGVVLLPP